MIEYFVISFTLFGIVLGLVNYLKPNGIELSRYNTKEALHSFQKVEDKD